MKFLFKSLLILALSAGFAMHLAQADDFDSSESFNFEEPLSIEGQFTEKRESQAERIKSLRRKLEKQNEQLVRKQLEQLRYKQELEMAERLQKIFDDNLRKIESIN